MNLELYLALSVIAVILWLASWLEVDGGWKPSRIFWSILAIALLWPLVVLWSVISSVKKAFK